MSTQRPGKTALCFSVTQLNLRHHGCPTPTTQTSSLESLQKHRHENMHGHAHIHTYWLGIEETWLTSLRPSPIPKESCSSSSHSCKCQICWRDDDGDKLTFVEQAWRKNANFGTKTLQLIQYRLHQKSLYLKSVHWGSQGVAPHTLKCPLPSSLLNLQYILILNHAIQAREGYISCHLLGFEHHFLSCKPYWCIRSS